MSIYTKKAEESSLYASPWVLLCLFVRIRTLIGLLGQMSTQMSTQDSCGRWPRRPISAIIVCAFLYRRQDILVVATQQCMQCVPRSKSEELRDAGQRGSASAAPHLFLPLLSSPPQLPTTTTTKTK